MKHGSCIQSVSKHDGTVKKDLLTLKLKTILFQINDHINLIFLRPGESILPFFHLLINAVTENCLCM